MNTNQQKAFDFAADTTKQLITLATGIIALAITFSKDIIGASELLALTGNLQPMSKTNNVNIEKTDIEANSNELNNYCETNINTKNVKIPSILQILSFIIGLILTVLFGVNSIKKTNQNIECRGEYIEIIKKTEYQIVKPKKIEKIFLKKD